MTFTMDRSSAESRLGTFAADNKQRRAGLFTMPTRTCKESISRTSHTVLSSDLDETGHDKISNPKITTTTTKKKRKRQIPFPSLASLGKTVSKRTSFSSSPNNTSKKSVTEQMGSMELSDECDTAAIMQSLIDERSWRQLQRLMESTPRGSASFSNTSEASRHSAQSLLHHALRLHGPLGVIRTIVMTNPNSILSLEPVNGRTALHIAAASWCEPEILAYLLSVHPNAASVLDGDRRCPLHLLLLPTAETSRDEDDRSSSVHWKWRHHSSYSRPSPSIIRTLLAAAPHTVNLEDDDGMSPLELALVSGHDIEYCVYNYMRRVSVKQWRRAERDKRNGRSCKEASARTCKNTPFPTSHPMLAGSATRFYPLSASIA